MKTNSTVVALLLFSIAAVSSVSAQRGGPKFSDWGPVVHLPPPINSEFNDQAPILSKDEKTLFFTSNRLGSEDIWVSTRQTPKSPWRTPVNLGSTINTPGIERLRSITSDGRVMLFMSDRSPSNGQTDIWATVRRNPNDNFGWSEPVNLGSTINSTRQELAARYLFSEGGNISKLFFSSDRLGGFGGPDIYESAITGRGFESPTNVVELNTPSLETCFWLRDDGLEIVFISNRPVSNGDLNYNDIYTATRDSVYESWSPPVKLENVSSDYMDVNPSLSFDGRTLLFASRRPGGIGNGTFDIYMTTRRRISGQVE